MKFSKKREKLVSELNQVSKKLEKYVGDYIGVENVDIKFEAVHNFVTVTYYDNRSTFWLDYDDIDEVKPKREYSCSDPESEEEVMKMFKRKKMFKKILLQAFIATKYFLDQEVED